MHILWETDSESQSIVEWGEYVFLTETTTGSSFTNYGSSRIHTIEIANLEPNTRYYYRVVLGDYDSYSDNERISKIFELRAELQNLIEKSDNLRP